MMHSQPPCPPASTHHHAATSHAGSAIAFYRTLHANGVASGVNGLRILEGYLKCRAFVFLYHKFCSSRERISASFCIIRNCKSQMSGTILIRNGCLPANLAETTHVTVMHYHLHGISLYYGCRIVGRYAIL